MPAEPAPFGDAIPLAGDAEDVEEDPLAGRGAADSVVAPPAAALPATLSADRLRPSRPAA
ncbi:MAG TPA: hypothetical protein VHA57_09475 [Actinomycetota bacterium]|nr:hypothetical protein [Actinomycetota bacterium]